MYIRQLNNKEIEPYIEECKKANLCFCNNTILFGLFIDDKLISFSGYRRYKNHVVIKNAFTLEIYRKKGYFNLILEFMLNKLGNINLEANCTKYSLNSFLRAGFILIKTFKNGIVKVERRSKL